MCSMPTDTPLCSSGCRRAAIGRRAANRSRLLTGQLSDQERYRLALENGEITSALTRTGNPLDDDR